MDPPPVLRLLSRLFVAAANEDASEEELMQTFMQLYRDYLEEELEAIGYGPELRAAIIGELEEFVEQTLESGNAKSLAEQDIELTFALSRIANKYIATSGKQGPWQGPNALTGTRRNILEQYTTEFLGIMGVTPTRKELNAMVDGFVANNQDPLVKGREFLYWAKCTDPFVNTILKRHNIHDKDEEIHIRQWVFSGGINNKAMGRAIAFLRLSETEQIERISAMKHIAHQTAHHNPPGPETGVA